MMTEEELHQQDREAWLDQNPADVQAIANDPTLDINDYWDAMENTLAWHGHVVGRRLNALGRAIFGKETP